MQFTSKYITKLDHILGGGRRLFHGYSSQMISNFPISSVFI